MKGSDVFKIKPLEWERGKDGIWFAELPHHMGMYFVRSSKPLMWQFSCYINEDEDELGPCTSSEEGKQLAEAHWNEYIKQALVEAQQ